MAAWLARHESPSLCRAKRRRAAAKEARAEERRLRELALAAAKKPARRSTRIECIRRARFYANPSYPYHVALAREISPSAHVRLPPGWIRYRDPLAERLHQHAFFYDGREDAASHPPSTTAQEATWASGGWDDSTPGALAEALQASGWGTAGWGLEATTDGEDGEAEWAMEGNVTNGDNGEGWGWANGSGPFL
ncbi:hypothetical protein C8R46DRAFT_1218154 [Mycena filopes]|nr:hypothetical protein C8R46DRAFT_1218154 [Mycena filopes]